MTRPARPLLLALAILAALIGAAVAQAPVSVGLAMWQAGYRATIAKGDAWFATRELAHGTLNPSSALLCVRPCEGGRWGFDRPTKGYMVGPEGTSREQVQAALDSGCLVLPGIPTGYQVTQLDYLDLMYLRHGSTSWYAARVQPCTRAANPQPTATPTPRPSPTPVATPVATPPPVVTPTLPPCTAMNAGEVFSRRYYCTGSSWLELGDGSCPSCPPPPPCEACPVYERATLPPEVVEGLAMLSNLRGPVTLWKAGRRATVERMKRALEGWVVYDKPRSTGDGPEVTLDAETPVPCAEVPAGVAVGEGDCEGGGW